uniref:Uncharacterized protein n=1 Tax=Chelydra serpentina TaxID=8475 RepID=A0A8C3T797_CHESE
MALRSVSPAPPCAPISRELPAELWAPAPGPLPPLVLSRSWGVGSLGLRGLRSSSGSHSTPCRVSSREVKTDEGKKLADSWGAVFLESSAKENQMTRGIFTKIIEEIDRVDNSYGTERSCLLM